MEVWIILVIVTMILSFFFSGSEIAFISANKLKIELDRKARKFSGRVLTFFIRHTSGFISSILLGNSIALILYGMAMAKILEPLIRDMFGGRLESQFLIMILQTLISTLIILLLAEFLPKALFRINPNNVLRVLSTPLLLFYLILFPFQFVFVRLSQLLCMMIFRVKFSEQKPDFGHIDLDNYLKEFSRANPEENEHAHEIQMIQNTIDFRNLKIRDCMIPRNEIIAVEKNDSIDHLKETFIRHGHSKVLIYMGTIDYVIGYAHSYDMFNNPQSIESVLKTILIAPETMHARDLLRNFIQSRKHAAVVVDEFGGTSGMITLEDLLEEIVGEINDEFDDNVLLEKKVSDQEYIFSGRLEIDYLNDKYKLGLPKDESYETLAGFILHHLEYIPPVNEFIVIEPFEFTILEASEVRIEKIRLKLIKG